MTGLEMPQDIARIIFFTCLGFMFVGVLLILASFKKSQKVSNEQLAIVLERLQVSEKKIKFRQEQIEKKEIPDKLLELDTYLANKIKNQNMSADTFISISKKWLKWHDTLMLIFVAITYKSSIGRRIFRKMHINYVLRFATRLNLVLREYKLGTLPIIDRDEDYRNLYEEIVRTETRLPIIITLKIHRFILVSISLNCLRLLSPERPYWKRLRVTRFESQFRSLINSLGLLLLPIDNAMTGLRAEISKDIEGYFVGD